MTDFEIYLKTYYLILLVNMPSKPIDYSKTHFYKIVCKDLSISDCYVGHTTDFTKRKSKHKGKYSLEGNRDYHLYVYQFIRNNGGWDNFDMILIKTVECNNSLEARKIERELIEELKATLNQRIPIISNEEKKEYKKNWSITNYENNKQAKKERKKRRYEAKKEQLLLQQKQRYNDNKEAIKAWKSIKNECECGGHYINGNKASHFKTNHHQAYLNQQEN